jgi:hypothetical protein
MASAGLIQGRFYLACGDVSGHGIGAALIMAMSRAFLRALLWQETQLSTALYKMNNLIEPDTPGWPVHDPVRRQDGCSRPASRPMSPPAMSRD